MGWFCGGIEVAILLESLKRTRACREGSEDKLRDRVYHLQSVKVVRAMRRFSVTAEWGNRALWDKS